MYESLIKRAQIVLLLAAVALAGIAFLPAESQATDPPEECASNCNGEPLPCGWEWDPITGQRSPCKQSIDCY